MTTKLLRFLFAIDAAIAVAFGMASWLFPHATYGTIVDLAGLGANGALTLSALSSLSSFYVLIGLVCLCAAFVPPPHAARIGVVMLARHAWSGIKGIQEAERAWIIGNPWIDVVIHAAFVLAYGFLVVRVTRGAARIGRHA
jgi:hypothetical protein